MNLKNKYQVLIYENKVRLTKKRKRLIIKKGERSCSYQISIALSKKFLVKHKIYLQNLITHISVKKFHYHIKVKEEHLIYLKVFYLTNIRLH